MDAPINTYDVGQAINLESLFLTGQTRGRMILNQSVVYVQDLSGLLLTPGSPIFVEGAGYVGGDLHTTVVSNDSVGAITVAASCKTEADQVTVGTPTDPTTVTCKVMLPAGTESTLSTTGVTTGLFRASYTPSVDGDFYYRFVGTGVASGEKWRKFRVRPQRVP